MNIMDLNGMQSKCEKPHAKLMLGDCIDKLNDVNSNSIDAIIADIPYNINYDTWDNFNLCDVIDALNRTLKSNGNLIIFAGYSNVTEVKQLLETKFTLQDWIIWDRIKGRGAKRHLVSTREDILWFTKSDNYTFNKISSNILKVTQGFGQRNGNEYRSLSNVWTDISPIVPWSKEKVNHPTQKPIQLMERCVKIWTNPHDTILDFTMGSGSTGIAALNLNRNFIGIERNLQYFQLAVSRFMQKQLFWKIDVIK